MPKQVEKILICNPGEKSIKAAFAIYLDLSVLLGQCLKDVHLIKKKQLNYYAGKDCIEKLYKKLKACAMKIIDCKEKGMIPLTRNMLYMRRKVLCG